MRHSGLDEAAEGTERRGKMTELKRKMTELRSTGMNFETFLAVFIFECLFLIIVCGYMR